MAIKQEKNKRLVFRLIGGGKIPAREDRVYDRAHSFVQLFEKDGEYFFQLFDDGLDTRRGVYEKCVLPISDLFRINRNTYLDVCINRKDYLYDTDALLNTLFGGPDNVINTFKLYDNTNMFSSERALTFIAIPCTINNKKNNDTHLYKISFNNGMMRGYKSYKTETSSADFFMKREVIYGDYVELVVKNIDNPDSKKLRVDPRKYTYTRIIERTHDFGIAEYEKYYYGLCYTDKNTGEEKWAVLNGKGDGYAPEFYSLWVEENKLKFRNKIFDENNIKVSCVGDIVEGDKKNGLENVKVEASTYYSFDFRDSSIPIEALSNYDPSEIKFDGNFFEMTSVINGIKYYYRGDIDEQRRIYNLKVDITAELAVPKDVIIDKEKLLMDEDRIKTIAEELKQIFETIREKFSYVSNKIEISHMPKNSQFFIGNYEGKQDASKNNLFQIDKEGTHSINNLDKPLYFEVLPNDDLMVVQADKTVVVLDGETKNPKAYISLPSDEKVTLTIVGEEDDYVFSGKIDPKTNHVSKLIGEGPFIPVYVENAKPTDSKKEITLEDIINLAQERIEFYGGKPAIHGKAKIKEIKDN